MSIGIKSAFLFPVTKFRDDMNLKRGSLRKEI
jgi:hypothetical protein